MKTAIVTGGGRGIGLGITKALAEAGFQIAVVGSSEEARYAQALSQLRRRDTPLSTFSMIWRIPRAAVSAWSALRRTWAGLTCW